VTYVFKPPREPKKYREKSFKANIGPSNASVRVKMIIRAVPTEQKALKDIGDSMLEWVLQPEVYCLDAFAIRECYSPKELKKRSTEDPYLGAVFDFCRAVLAKRLQDGWRDNLIDKDYAKTFLWRYDDEYRAMVDEKVKATINAFGNKQERFIIMERAPESDMVPSRAIDVQGE
jgi:hypothetical protein